jgi:hypothetical protein
MNKALRLPIILVALMLMIWIGWSFRPKTNMVVRDGNTATATTERFDPDKLDPDMVIDGRKVSEYAPLETTPLESPISAKDPKNWSLVSVSLIKATNGKTMIYFIDGSSREVTPNLVKLLPSELQTRLSYEGPQ